MKTRFIILALLICLLATCLPMPVDASVSDAASLGRVDTGVDPYNARYYDPELGRFISPDTIVQDPSNPQTLNRYSYVLNNPLKFTDPSGHFLWVPFLISAALMTINVAGTAWDIYEISQDPTSAANWTLFAVGLIDPTEAGKALRYLDEAADVAKGLTATDLRYMEQMRPYVQRVEEETQVAIKMLQSGGDGGTAWGRNYQRQLASGVPHEQLAKEYGNAIHQIASNALEVDPLFKKNVWINQKSLIGLQSSKRRPLRPDFQVKLGDGMWGIIDITTVKQAGKITNYADPRSPYVFNVLY